MLPEQRQSAIWAPRRGVPAHCFKCHSPAFKECPLLARKEFALIQRVVGKREKIHSGRWQSSAWCFFAQPLSSSLPPLIKKQRQEGEEKFGLGTWAVTSGSLWREGRLQCVRDRGFWMLPLNLFSVWPQTVPLCEAQLCSEHVPCHQTLSSVIVLWCKVLWQFLPSATLILATAILDDIAALLNSVVLTLWDSYWYPGLDGCSGGEEGGKHVACFTCHISDLYSLI